MFLEKARKEKEIMKENSPGKLLDILRDLPSMRQRNSSVGFHGLTHGIVIGL